MDPPPIELVVRAVRGGGAIQGTVVRSGRPAERFSGWLEFTAAVARLLPDEDGGTAVER